MCNAKPGERCASDTCDQAAATTATYEQAFPEGPAVTPVDAASPTPWFPERDRQVHRARRDHDFYPPAGEMASWPTADAAFEVPARERRALARYTSNHAEWYVLGVDPTTGQGYGFATLGEGEGRGWYQDIDLPELEASLDRDGEPVRRDLDFVPALLGDALAARSEHVPSHLRSPA